MTDVFAFHPGSSPLVISVPHDGWQIPNDILQHMTGEGRGIPDTDWHVTELYQFARELGASMLTANFSRYVVDLNRPPDDAALYAGQLSTGLCPRQTFAGDDIYFDEIDIDTAERVEQFWRPYHEQLESVLASCVEQHGCALLWDAHSIASTVPSLFEGELPVLNIGTNDGASCDATLLAAVADAASESDYSTVVNGRFKGGFITRHYGRPESGVHAIQLELAQRAYMDERSLEFDKAAASRVTVTLRAMLDAYLAAAQAL